MSENTETRQDVVEDNIEAVETQYGADNINRLIAVCLKDISVSLAMLVDSSSSSGT